METRANYILVGLFTLAVIAGGFGFVYWFTSPSSGPERKRYDVVFDGTVSGLRPGGWVLFNGLRVGDVASLRIDPEAPRQVIAVIYVDKDVVLRQDTGVGLEFQGLTGFATIALRGGSPTAPLLDPPVLRADLGSTQDLSSAARSVLRRLDTVVSENEVSVRSLAEEPGSLHRDARRQCGSHRTHYRQCGGPGRRGGGEARRRRRGGALGALARRQSRQERRGDGDRPDAIQQFGAARMGAARH